MRFSILIARPGAAAPQHAAGAVRAAEVPRVVVSWVVGVFFSI